MISAETQRHERLPINVEVQAFDPHGSESCAGVTANVSESGLFVLLEPTPAVGAVFPLELKLRRKQIRALARVVWKQEPQGAENQTAGVGVEFLAVRDKPGLKRALQWHKARFRPST